MVTVFKYRKQENINQLKNSQNYQEKMFGKVIDLLLQNFS